MKVGKSTTSEPISAKGDEVSIPFKPINNLNKQVLITGYLNNLKPVNRTTPQYSGETSDSASDNATPEAPGGSHVTTPRGEQLVPKKRRKKKKSNKQRKTLNSVVITQSKINEINLKRKYPSPPQSTGPRGYLYP